MRRRSERVACCGREAFVDVVEYVEEVVFAFGQADTAVRAVGVCRQDRVVEARD